MTMFIIWLLVSSALVLMVSLGAYLLVSPGDNLIVRYQNIRLSMTGMPLKDEDFPNMPRVVFLLKSCGAFMVIAGIGLLYTIILSA